MPGIIKKNSKTDETSMHYRTHKEMIITWMFHMTFENKL
jgi:hypothetical protein